MVPFKKQRPRGSRCGESLGSFGKTEARHLVPCALGPATGSATSRSSGWTSCHCGADPGSHQYLIKSTSCVGRRADFVPLDAVEIISKKTKHEMLWCKQGFRKCPFVALV